MWWLMFFWNWLKQIVCFLQPNKMENFRVKCLKTLLTFFHLILELVYVHIGSRELYTREKTDNGQKESKNWREN